MRYLASGLKLAYFSKGATIASPETGIAGKLHIIQRGQVRGELADPPGRDVVEYADGECFPVAAVTAKRASTHIYVALEDTFCFEVDADVVAELARRSAPFQAFCSGRANALLQRSFAALRTLYSEQSASSHAINMRLGDILRRPVLQCLPDDTLQRALQAMHARKVGAIIIAQTDGVPLGIFTERDLLRCAASGTLDLNATIETLMTGSPICLPMSASAAEAAVKMVASGIRHIVVVDDGKLAGVVSERDLFALQRTTMRGIIGAIDTAVSAPALVQAAADVRKLAVNMLAQGVGAEQLTQLITSLNDKLAARIVALEAARHGIEDIDWCWIALGSEGRHEQTLSTDQDNAIIFASGESAPVTRDRLLPFASAVNATLDACGFPLCKGGIMAGNPKWCLSLVQWQECFANWIQDPLPKALLHSTIFYDFRPLSGNAELAQALRAWLIARVKDDARFLRAMAQSALDSPPPLGLFSSFQTSSKDGSPGTLDLKVQGTRPFVDAARVMALASGIGLTGTTERLRACADAKAIPRDEAEALIEAFHFILLVRFRHHLNGNPALANPNRIDPASLNELDRRILKEAFRQARKLQTRMSLEYQL